MGRLVLVLTMWYWKAGARWAGICGAGAGGGGGSVKKSLVPSSVLMMLKYCRSVSVREYESGKP